MHFPKDLGYQDLSAVIVAGLGGGLDPELKIGDVVVDGMDRTGVICSSDQLAGSVEQKRKIFEKTGAKIVEMEGDFVRKWLANKEVRLIGVRSVSDRADEELDSRLLSWVDGYGRPRWRKLLGSLVCRPGLIALLWRLSQNSHRACETLGQAVRQILATLVLSEPYRNPVPPPIHPPDRALQ